MAASLEMMFEIWDDEHGSRLEVGEDRDSLGLTEIRSKGPDDKIDARMTFTDEQVPLVIEALQRFMEWKKSRPSS
jgi:hypothetical protein